MERSPAEQVVHFLSDMYAIEQQALVRIKAEHARSPKYVFSGISQAEVVDRYEEVASSLQEDVDEVEKSVFSTQRTNDSARIYVLKRELAEMRRAVLPLREPMSRFADGTARGIHSDAAPYFRDVADHLTRVSEAMESLDLLLSSAFVPSLNVRIFFAAPISSLW